MRIAFASGKGGTGKTMLSTSFARLLGEAAPGRVTYADADVEEPNGHLYLTPDELSERRGTVPLPRLTGRCSGCRACQDACAFNAILALDDSVMVFPELCHSCGVCVSVCPERALEEQPREIGTISLGRSPWGRLASGKLDVGVARSVPLIEEVLEDAGDDRARAGITVVDCPPGSSCPVMTAVRDSDLVVLVTETTPFGLHDLQLAMGMCRKLGLSVVAVLNRCDLGDQRVERYLAREGIELVGKIPFDRRLAASHAAGQLAVDGSPAVRATLDSLLARPDVQAAVKEMT